MFGYNYPLTTCRECDTPLDPDTLNIHNGQDYCADCNPDYEED